ncbi:hypothetical protein ACO0QE_002694 [Hanseniaspora vineae]
MSDLIVLQRNYIIKQLNDIHTKNGLKFLVIDQFVKTLLEYLFTDLKELLSFVTALDFIDDPKRKGQTSSSVIYLLEPTRFNINCIDADFSNRPARYKEANIMFLRGVGPDLQAFYSTKKYIPQYMVLMKELDIAFIPKESQYFETIGAEDSMQLFYNKSCIDLVDKIVERTVLSLLSVCVLTGEYPIIRYCETSDESYQLNNATLVAQKIATDLHDALKAYALNNEDFPPVTNEKRKASVLIITDRSFDLFSPIIHSFSYQAMAYDLVNNLNIQTDVYNYEAENEAGEIESKHSRIRELNDPDWCDLRHQHILDAKEQINSKINSLIQANPLLVDRSRVKNTTDLLSVIAHLGEFDKERKIYTLHKTLIDECLKVNEERQLAVFSDFEQIVSGYGQDANGEKVKHMQNTLVCECLVSDKPALTDKVRYIILYALYRGGLIEQDFLKLLAFIGVEQEHPFFAPFMSTINNFEQLGFKMIKETPKNKGFRKEWHHETIINDSTIYNSSRFVPAAGNCLSKAMTNALFLDEQQFPYVGGKPVETIANEEPVAMASSSVTSSTSLRNPRHKASWSIKRNNDKKNIVRQRFFYYVVGGVTHAELKAAYDQSALKNKDVFIGSDCILDPLSFMQEVGKLTTGRAHLDLKIDRKKNEKAPDFLFDRAMAPTPASAHVHIEKKQPGASINNAKQTKEEPPVKEKKRSRFKKLFK